MQKKRKADKACDQRNKKVKEKLIVPKEWAVRLVKSVFFWGIAAGLGYSSYINVQKIRDAVKVIAVQESAGDLSVTADAEQESTGIQGVTADGANQRAVTEQDGVNDQNAILISQEQKTIALTFDDGPHPVYTKKLLDGLKERQVHATFFVVGKNIPGNEALIEQMKEDGHLIGNHTYDHVKICDMSSEDACEQVEKTSELVYEITGENTEFVRPPFGAWNKNMECSFVMLPVLWDVDPLDWTTRNTDLIVQRVLDEVENGDIVLLHDYYDSSVEAAFQIIDVLKEQGYEFVTADEMLLE